MILSHASSFAPVPRATLNSSLPLNIAHVCPVGRMISLYCNLDNRGLCLCHFLVPDTHMCATFSLEHATWLDKLSVLSSVDGFLEH